MGALFKVIMYICIIFLESPSEWTAMRHHTWETRLAQIRAWHSLFNPISNEGGLNMTVIKLTLFSVRLR